LPTIVTITFDPNTTPQFQVSPDPVDVQFGNHQVIWNLETPGAAFAPNGIDFGSNSPGTLTQNSATKFTLADDNTNTSGNDADYNYSINIVYNGQTYTDDPEVANRSGSGASKLRYKSS